VSKPVHTDVASRQAAALRSAVRPRGWHGAGALAAALLLVAIAVAAAHWPVLGAQALSFDDNDFVTYNPLVTHPGWASTSRFFTEVLNPSTVRGYYLPLSMTSLMLDYAMGGRPGDLRVFHQTSLALHLLATLLLILFLYRLSGAIAPAALAGLLFGLHPLTVEPVAWIGERKTLLAAAFAFASLLTYVEHCRRADRAWLPVSATLFALALLSKPTVAMLPLLLLLLDYWPLRRLSWRSALEKWPFFILSLASGVITLISHQRTAGIAAASQATWLQWSLHAAYLLAFYLGKIISPVNLSCVYQPPAPFSLSNPTVLVGVAVVVAVTATVFLLGRRTRGPLIGWLFFALALGPTLGLVKYSWVIASDKYVYFPAAGVLLVLASGLALAWGWAGRRPGGPALRVALLGVVLVVAAAEAGGVRAALRNWTDSLTLFRHMEAMAPDAPAVHNELGVLLAGQSAEPGAIRHLRRALELAPDYSDAHYNLGVVLGSSGQVEEAIGHFRRAIQLSPADPHTAYNLGAALRLEGKLDEAEAELRRALHLKPDYVEAADRLADVLVLQGRLVEAVEQLRGAVAVAPGDPRLHFRLAMALTGRGAAPTQVAEELQLAIRCGPGWADPYNALAWLLATSPDETVRDPRRAVPIAERAAELTGRRDPKVLDTLAAAQASAGQFDLAVATARAALGLAAQPGGEALAREIGARLRLYERHIAYTEPEGGPRPPAPAP
jgi:Flp pilus assembly protein TadD